MPRGLETRKQLKVGHKSQKHMEAHPQFGKNVIRVSMNELVHPCLSRKCRCMIWLAPVIGVLIENGSNSNDMEEVGGSSNHSLC